MLTLHNIFLFVCIVCCRRWACIVGRRCAKLKKVKEPKRPRKVKKPKKLKKAVKAMKVMPTTGRGAWRRRRRQPRPAATSSGRRWVAMAMTAAVGAAMVAGAM